MTTIDIAQRIGQVESIDAARKIFEDKMDADNLAKIETIKNETVLLKIANAIAMGEPDAVVVVTESDADQQWVKNHALEKGEEKTLPMEGHTIHYDLAEEQGRIVDRTYYIINEGEKVSSLGQKMVRDEAEGVIKEHMGGIMRGKTLMIGFFCRGPVGAPASNPAVEMSTSAYVLHSANILYRNVFNSFEKEAEARGHIFVNVHSEGKNRTEDLPNARVFMDRKDRTTYSFNCTYAGNTLLMKKGNHRFAVDKSVYEERESQLAEHMFVTGIKGPNNRVTWCTGAAPSGCGKTTTAMAGDYFVGDDLAQMWIAKDGTVRAINPECGIFGIVEDVNMEGDPVLMEKLRNPGAEVIFSNVLIDDNGVPNWVGQGEDIPDSGVNFQGKWEKGMKDANGKEIPPSHPNARCTIASTALTNYSEEAENPDGVETRIVTYSGRDADTMPPVWAAKDSDNGVVIGACIVSAATATEVGASGVKRAPWANASFIPGSLGDYMSAQFDFFASKKIADDKRPILAGLNYFLTDEARGGTSKKLLGEKKDVRVWLSWLERYVHGDVTAIETPIGNLPKYDDLKELFSSLISKQYDYELYEKQFSLYIDNIVGRIDLQDEAYKKDEQIPGKLFDLLAAQKSGLVALKEKHGAVVTPKQLEG